MKKILRLPPVALWEAWSYILLVFVGMPLKYGLGWPWAVKVVGPIHGLLFVAYVLVGALEVRKGGWSLWESVQLFAASLIPFGPMLIDGLIRTKTASAAPAHDTHQPGAMP